MFRPIRRKDNALPLSATDALLGKARRGVLAMQTDEGYPYALPVNYLYDCSAQKIYFHSSRAGYKVETLKKWDKVCFTVCGKESVQEESWAPFVESAVVFGRCYPIEDPLLSLSVLKRFAMKYYPEEQMVDEEIERAGKAVQMYEIIIEHRSGKKVQEK